MTWADTDYGYKKKITIDNTKVAGDEVNFPILISVTDANLADTSNGGQVESSDGYDIVFYNDDEDTRLNWTLSVVWCWMYFIKLTRACGVGSQSPLWTTCATTSWSRVS